MPKEPTRQQLSSRLAYSAQTPAFLLKLQKRVAGEDEEEDDEYEYDGSGRPPIPRRPAIPERPEGDPGSADEDDLDEKPQVVVLKEGKHLTQWEVENERRKAKGLPPLPKPEEGSDVNESSKPTKQDANSSKSKTPVESLSFSSRGDSKPTAKKRKAVGTLGDEEGEAKPAKKSSKKPKKAEKKLLSFGDGDES